MRRALSTGGAWVLLAAVCLIGPAAAAAQDPPPDDRFDVTLLDKTITQGTRITIAPDGRVFLAERDGRLKIWKPETKTTVLAGQIPTGQPGELGFMGLALVSGLRDDGLHLRPLRPD